MRLGLLATTALIVMLFAGNTARACECASPVDPFESAEVVFQGELIGIKRTGADSRYSRTYTFSADRILKGPVVKTIDLVGDGSDCEMQFEPNAVYVVYANSHEGRFTSSVCSGTRILARSKVYRTYDTVESTSLLERWFRSALIACGLGVLLGSGAFVWRRFSTRLP